MKKHLYSVIFAVVLCCFTAYVLLDTFVIPQKGAVTQPISSALPATTKPPSEEEIETTETSYSDENIQITITELRKNSTTVYVADIQLASAELLKTAFAEGAYGKNIKAKTSDIAAENNAVLAINGDYYGFRTYGYVVRNGVIYRDVADPSADALVVYTNGSFEIVSQSSTTAEALVESGAWQILSFGPALIKNGSVAVDENDEVSQSKTSNPRTAIGIIDTLHYVMVVSDGRTDESEGLSLYELAGILQDYGCQTAYNLDGGGSSTMYFCGKIINNPTDGRTDTERKVSDIVYIGY